MTVARHRSKTGSPGFGVSGIWVKACDATCCSQGALLDESEAPLGCQVDCCV